MSVQLWTDGSGTASGPGGWAYVLRAVDADGDPLREIEASGWVLDTTSQRMEVSALLAGLRALRAPSTVVLYSDSQYVVKTLTDGRLPKWVAKRWKDVKNVDLWTAVIAELERGVSVDARWVKGHAKVELNERCDKLAGAARRRALDLLDPEPDAD